MSEHELAALRRLDRLIWGLVAATGLAVAAACLLGDFRIGWRTFVAPGLACAVLLAATSFYTRWRADARLASGLASTAQVIAFAAVAAPLSYVAAAFALPLQDPMLDAVDHALGLDWRTLLQRMNDWPALFVFLRPIYLSLMVQMTLAVLCLAFSGRLIRLRVYTLAFVFAALATIAVSAVLPAAGAWPHYGLSAADSPHIVPSVQTSWPVFFGLRDGSLRLLVGAGSEGIITFPSLHAALAVILIIALWPVALLRWPVFGLNILMLAATPIDGSHYFIDVFAGIALAVPCLVAAGAAAARTGLLGRSNKATEIRRLVGREEQISL
jgi:membrane-associated phospholipid phosphatase